MWMFWGGATRGGEEGHRRDLKRKHVEGRRPSGSTRPVFVLGRLGLVYPPRGGDGRTHADLEEQQNCPGRDLCGDHVVTGSETFLGTTVHTLPCVLLTWFPSRNLAIFNSVTLRLT